MLLTSTTNAFEAKVIAARLQAEGLQPELRGVDGPYPLLYGALAVVGIWVPEDEMNDAQLVMLATEIDNAVGEQDYRPPVWTIWGRIAVAVVLASVVVVSVVRVLLDAS